MQRPRYDGHVANINDVAKRAGVSPTTAKRAVRSPEKLAPETLERVRRAIDDLQYEPDQLAAALRSRHNNTVGLIVGSIVEPFFATLTRTVGRAVRARGYTFILAESEYRADLELPLLKGFYGNRVAGLILRSGYGEPNLDYLRHMQQSGTQIVEIDHVYPGSPFSQVTLDGTRAVGEGVAHLARLGHRRIAALGDHRYGINEDERSRAFPEAMAAAGLPLPDAYRRAIPPVEEDAHELAKHLMSLPEPPTALFALNGTMAVGTYKALRELGLRVPDDVSLLAFDDYPWTSLVEPGIDVLDQPVEAMGLAAVELLFDAIGRDASAADRRRFPATLIRRGSCAPPGGPDRR